MSEDREHRNSVFSGTGSNAGVQTMTANDRAKADFGFEIPVETVPLPSYGKVYSEGSPLALVDTVDIRSMTARDEDILTSRALLKKGTVITELIKSCLVDKRVNPSDLLTGDRNALMVAIRITGYGAEYEAETECSECSEKTMHSFNLGELPIKRLEIDPVEPCSNVFDFTLPVTKKNVRFKFLTGRDEEEISATSDKQKKLQLNIDSSVTTNLLYSLVSVDGITDRAKLANFVKIMPARDSLALRSYIRDNEPGMIMKQDAACKVCEHVEEVDMPLGVSFLWPSTKR